MKNFLSTVMVITVMALSSTFAQEKIKHSDLDLKSSGTSSQKFPVNNLQTGFFTAEETILMPGAFSMPCIDTEYPLDLPMLEFMGLPIFFTGNNIVGDYMFGQVFKESFNSRQVLDVQTFILNLSEKDGDIYAYVYDLDENDMPSAQLGKSEPVRVSDIEIDGNVYRKKFTFTTPVEVTGNFAVVIELPEFDFFETIVAVATSAMGCYSNKNYAVTYTLVDEDVYEWKTLGEVWGLDSPDDGYDYFEMAIFVTLAGEEEPEPVSLNPQNENMYSIYPNPATDVIYVANASESTVRIIDTTGKVILEKSVEYAKEVIEINHLEKGMYFIEITGKGTKNTTKFIKR